MTLALRAMLRGKTAVPPTETGFEVEGFLNVLRNYENGPSARIGPDLRPETVLVAEYATLVGVVAGALIVDQAIASVPEPY